MLNKDDFFKIIDYLQDESKISDIPPEVRTLADNCKLRTQVLFKNVVDSAPFASDDYNRLRSLLIDWYTSLKTFQDVAKNNSDAFSLPHTLLNTSLKSFGFNVGRGIANKIDKVLFLMN